jgi:murein DD-endopeptidase MepM/ murein hydrolase activator NlpD
VRRRRHPRLSARGSRRFLRIAVCALVAGLATSSAQAESSDQPVRLAGLLPLTDPLRSAWPFSGAFYEPVGDARDFSHGETPDSAGFRVLRGMTPADSESAGHLGVDLGNGRGGGTVRAASGGLVVRGARDGSEQGYGECVVLAHRLADGRVVYSVYAHLLEGSLTVRAGDRVWAGRKLGRVGRSGRATTYHLHFEIRQPASTSDRWEHAQAVDPLEFVAARLAPARREATWDARYLEWATMSALVDPMPKRDEVLEQRIWWPMLARLVGIEQPPADHERLADALIARDLLPASARLERGGPVSWSQMRDGAARLVARGHLAAIAQRTGKLAGDARHHLGVAAPMGKPSLIGQGQGERPTIAQACLLLAALCADSAAVAPARP